MERLIIVAVLGLLIFVLLQTTKKVKDVEYFGDVEKKECKECAVTSLEPNRVCPTGLCTQMRGRAGCSL